MCTACASSLTRLKTDGRPPRTRKLWVPEVLTASAPWLAAFAFGLLHGFGLAGALFDLGLASREIPLALLFFNVGVEIGQS